MKLTNKIEGWHLALHQGFIQLIQIDFRLGIFLSDASDTAKLYIAKNCLLESPSRKDILRPEEPPSLAPFLAFMNAKVAGIVIGKTGQLRLELESSSFLEVSPNDLYESWELHCSIGFMMICSPGGSISLFGESQMSDSS